MSWRDAAKGLRSGVLETLGELVTVRTKNGASAQVRVSWEADEDESEANGGRYIRGYMDEAELAGFEEEFGVGWVVTTLDGDYKVYQVDERRLGGVGFRARRED